MKTMEATAKADQSDGSDALDIEPLLQALGPRGLGLYQLSQMVLQLLNLFGVAFTILGVVFIGYQPPYRCASVNVSTLETMVGLEENFTQQLDVVYEKCSIHVTANQSGTVQFYSLPCVGGYDYEGAKHTSFFTEWDLTCEKSGMAEVTQTMVMVGQGLGALVFNSLADRYGRKSTHVMCTLGMLTVSVATALSPNYVFLLVCRVAIGALQQGSGLVGYTMFLELLPKYLRRAAGVIDGTAWSCSVMLLPLLAYLVQDYSWRYLQLLMAAFSAYSLILPWCMDESLRWLVANGKKKEAERILKKASRINGVQYHKVQAALEILLHCQATGAAATSIPLSNEKSEKPLGESVYDGDSGIPDENTDQLLGEQRECTQNEPIHEDFGNNGPVRKDMTHSEPIKKDSANSGPINKDFAKMGPAKGDFGNDEPVEGGVASGGGEPAAVEADGVKVKRYTLLDILRHGVLRRTACVIWYLWITNSLTYYSLTLTSSSLAGNRFLNFFLQGMVELPAYITVFFALRRFGRRNVICVFLILASFALLLSSVLIATVTGPEIALITNFLSLLGKYAISGSFGTIFIFCPELFPTNLRSAGLGMSSAVARIGGMVAPFSQNLADIVLWGPSVISGSMASLAAYIVLKLPETRGRPLPTTIEEMKAWHKMKPGDVGQREILYNPLSKK